MELLALSKMLKLGQASLLSATEVGKRRLITSECTCPCADVRTTVSGSTAVREGQRNEMQPHGRE